MRFLCIVFILIFVSCTKDKVRLNEDFVFSYDNGISFKNFKFTNDTVFMAKNYPNHDYVFYLALEEDDKKHINIFLDDLKKQNFKKEYIQDGIKDAGTYQIQFFDRNRLIYVYGFNGEDEIKELKNLNKFSSFLIDLEISKMIKYNDTTHYGMEKVYWNRDIDFGNVERFIIPGISYDTIY